jgi:DNA topoisomerase-2
MSNAALAKQYQKKTDLEHILDAPDTYIGGVELTEGDMWIHSEEGMIFKNINYVPGLYKIFDEGIVNARDHVVRMINANSISKHFVTMISVNVSNEGVEITNDGNGIDVAKHPEHDIWIPEMIFGHLRTSTNYDKNEKRIVGGKNGFGFKLAVCFSTASRIETVDHTRKLKYVQEFGPNLSTIGKPVITKCTTKPYTKVFFKPDFARFGITGFNEDMMAMLKRRVYDIAAVTDHSIKKVKISFNGEQVPVKSFQNYIDMYIGTRGENKRIYEAPEERWEYAVALSPTQEFMQVSFVNGISTNKGGKHVDFIMGQVIRKLCDYIYTKKKVRVSQSAIKEQLILFLRCDIENPSFESQTKDYMNTPLAKFGSSCTVSNGFIEKIAKLGVMDVAMSISDVKSQKLAKKTDGAKVKTIRGIPNFIDANLAGTQDSKKCVLILCEGLSAASGVISGLSAGDRDTYGIYPLRGKLLNTRGETVTKIAANKEITELKKILGLETDVAYTKADINERLRYGRILILTDQDLDGSHIKALIINAFESMWPSIANNMQFISFMNTPILRATKGAQTKEFYNEGQYSEWKESLGGSTTGWKIKYYKGLGTSTSALFKEYFKNKKTVELVQTATCPEMIDTMFNKKRANDRKEWLKAYDKDVYLDTDKKAVSYDEFINKEAIHFSIYDCERSIPNMVDGLKTSQRKVLFSAFKRKLTNEIKVAQFSGYVSEHSCYHHGESSLNGTIVNMAQNYMGSNNINLLMPNGQFGTRLHNGSDSASERYIFTQLNSLTRCIFREADDPVLTYLDDDGTQVEPEFYLPIIPMILVNGALGIGTGFSSNVPQFNPSDVAAYLKHKLKNEKYECDFMPYYEGFGGTVTRIEPQKYMTKGVYEAMDSSTIHITELPVGTSTMSFISFVEGLIDKKTVVRDLVSNSTEVTVSIKVTFARGSLVGMMEDVDEHGVDGVHKLLKLTSTLSTSNMHMFDAKKRLKKYMQVAEIIDEYAEVRLQGYETRKRYMIERMEKELVRLSNRARYILETLEGKVDLRKKKADVVTKMLEDAGYDKIDDSFKYLTKMPMDSVQEENAASIMKERDDMQKDLDVTKKRTPEKMWELDLADFEKEYAKYQTAREKLQSIPADKTASAKKRVVKKAGSKAKTTKK